MGKKSKKILTATDEKKNKSIISHKKNEETDIQEDVKGKEKSKKLKKDIETCGEEHNIVEGNEKTRKRKITNILEDVKGKEKSKKLKKDIETCGEEHNIVEENEEPNVISVKTKKKKYKHKDSANKAPKDINKAKVKISKKIKFGDNGEPQTKNLKKKTEEFNDDESNVRDEDIEEFCNELDEEDNVQYENWVKLVEDRLKSNKNK